MIYVLLGQTASGKTSLALSLARRFDVPILSADAYQCYKAMQVGTDKPKREEVEGLEYYFYDEYTPDQDISVYTFQKEGRSVIEDCSRRKKDLLVVGGNFLYVKALLFNYVFPEQEGSPLDNPYEDKPLKELQEELLKRSPETYNAIDTNNPRRVIRALVQLDMGTNKKEIVSQNKEEPIYSCEFYALTIDKEEGNRKIDERIDRMAQEGLFEEVKKLYKEYPSSTRLFSTIGYKEVIADLKEGREPDEKTLSLIKVHTHQYAKKQRTFLRHQFKDITYGTRDEIESLLIQKLN